jgi:DNA polymerase III delta prime subunit
MSAYDFTGLSPSDFEALCRDLLECSLGVPIQSFVTGRDNGIDLRHAPMDGQDWIVQCKHFARSGYAKLRSHIFKKELPKIKKLRPKRYILATSLGLTPFNVDDLFTLLSPYCTSRHDIIGQDELNALLRANPTVEQAHFKLWLTSEAVLSRVLHNDVFVQSILTEEQIRQKLGLYVYTDSFQEARKKLRNKRVCILSGVPGVGKTTLAEMLLIEYLMDGWQLVTIHQNIAEGQRAFRHDKTSKQVFYYDDFLGQISTGEKLGKNEDRALLQLIEAVSRTANKRFILTTREYILAQAKAEHEHLARSGIDLHRFVVSCEDYTAEQKARILANHLYFAEVPQRHIAALVKKGVHRRIISHSNYNPRIIEWMTRVPEVSACRSASYPSVFLKRLDNPSALWTHAFENQVGEASRHLLLVLGSCGNGIVLGDLQEAFEAFYIGRSRQYGFQASPSSFRKALDELEGNFIQIERASGQLVVSCHNPSVLDFLNEWLSEHPEDVEDIMRYATFFEQVERLFNVFGIGNKLGREGRKGKEAGVVTEALARTLSARPVGLSKADSIDDEWLRKPSSIWQRLGTCCRIGNEVADAPLRKAIQGHIDNNLANIHGDPGRLWEIMSLFDIIGGCKWLHRRTIDEWHCKVFSALMAVGRKFEESLYGLSAVAEWLVANRRRFDDHEACQLEERLSSAVSHEVVHHSGLDDPQQVASDLANVEQIAQKLGRSFSDEIRRLREALTECGEMEGYDADALREYDPEDDTSSIDSLFEALLE